jgi:glycosyltransferase involved in cell wall biosynthesis
MVGTRGVPARYGGFETCVEEVGQRLVKAGHDVVVYCRTTAGPDELDEFPQEHLGMRLVYQPAVPKKTLETLSHTGMSALHLVRHRTDVALVFNSANSPFVPMLRARGIPVATHVDGLEWKRAKWQGTGRRYYRMAESMAVRWSDALIADAQGIADYYRAEFDAPTELIAYGAPILIDESNDMVRRLGLRPRRYHLVVARFEPENHVDMIVEGYARSRARLPLVVVGSAPYADAYTARIRSLCDDRVRLLGSVWDQRLLDQLYANSATYLHGHSVGGTNPSLLRAAGAGASTIAFDVNFNREVLDRAGRYFRTADQVTDEVELAESDGFENARRGALARARALHYDWDDVARRYESLCQRLAHAGVTTRRTSGRPSGRRRGVTVAAGSPWETALTARPI